MAETAFGNVSAADIAVAMNEVEKLERTYRGVQGAKAVLAVLAGRKQIGDELDRRIEAKRATIADLEKVTVDQFKAQGEAEAKRIVAEAEAKAKDIIAEARQRADEADTVAAAKRAELATINAQLSDVRKQAAALAG